MELLRPHTDHKRESATLIVYKDPAYMTEMCCLDW